MKKFFLLLVVSFISVCVIAEPIDAVLIVQNHASDEYQKPLSNLGDAISAELSQELFNIIDPNDVIGEQQNRGPWGENMPLSSATRLAENLDAQILITAAVGETSIISYGSPAKANAVKMRLTLSAKRIPKGSNVASVTVTEVSKKFTPSMLGQNADSIYYDLVENLVAKASKEFLAKCEKVAWKDMKIKLIEVAFGCNFPGADVSIDGVSYGTAGTIGEAPLKVKVSDGLHNVKISYPYTTPFEVRAKLQEGTTFMVVLRENEEGRKIRKEDTHFDALMDRIEKSGATDDQVRLLRARGYGEYLSSSYTRIKGMPQVLSMRDCEMPDFGLNPDKNSDGTGTSTKDLFNQAGSALGLNDAEAAPSPLSSGVDDDVETDGDEDAKTNEEQSKEEKSQRERHDNTDVGVAIPLEQQQPQENSYTPVQQQPVQPVQAPIQQSQQPVDTQAQPPSPSLIDGLEAVKTGVDTGKSIIEGIKAIGNILQ